MNKFLFISFTLLSCLLYSFKSAEKQSIIEFKVPENWPSPVYSFEENPTTEAGFQLGRTLFYDPKLSRDSSISCASCHLQYTGFTHVDHAVSHGIEGRKGTRNAPALINLAWNNTFHWDGGVNHIEVQAINPIQHSAEMDNTLENVLAYLNASTKYRTMFFEAFGDSTPSTKTLLKSITQFTTSLVSSNSKYDQFLRSEIEFNNQEQNGLNLFQKNCASCHTAPLFNSNEFKSNGLAVDTSYNDVGRYAITHVPSDSLKFRVPTLRNIEYTFPYMHDGRFKKLKEVLDHYTSEVDYRNRYLSAELRSPIVLNDTEKKDLIAFLYTLTDRSFLYNKRYSFPR